MRTLVKVGSLCLALLAVAESPAAGEGKIIVIGSTMALSNIAFSGIPDSAAALAGNCAVALDAGTGSFLVYSNHPALTGSSLAAAVTSAGYSWTVDTSAPLTLDLLQQYDAVWLAGANGTGPRNAVVLNEYVSSGGNVLIMGGAIVNGIPDAPAWGPFLSAFGLELQLPWVTPCVPPEAGQTLAPTDHPLADGVTSIQWGAGSPVFLSGLPGPGPLSGIIGAEFPGCEFEAYPVIGVYDGTVAGNPADLDGDGQVGGADLGLILGAWGAAGGPEDLTGDGVVDGADLGALLAAWGDR